ncbi:MAG TPA: GntR family transcriptional regulator [Chthoniobacteraceae bacterium]|nr:GntR family transcriptional regulator [Chthoniobacteraceae bacterium]
MTSTTLPTKGTKTARIIENLGQRLRGGEWQAEVALPPVTALSQEYQVSPRTVALAIKSLEREGLVTVLPRQGVFAAMEKGATPGSGKVNLIIGVYGRTPSWKGDYVSSLVNSILDAAHNMDASVVILPRIASGEALNREWCERQGLKGLIVLGSDALLEVKELKEEGFPVITANMPVGATAMNYVSFDHADDMRSMTARFAAAGHRRIAVLAYETDTAGLYESFKTDFIRALCDADIHYNLNPYWRLLERQPDGAVRDVKETVGDLLALPEPPTAIFLRRLLVAPVLKQLEYHELSVPGDVSVICAACDDEESALTSGFVLPFPKLGKRLVEGLHEIIRNPFHSVQELIPTHFVDKGTLLPPSKGKTHENRPYTPDKPDP